MTPEQIDRLRDLYRNGVQLLVRAPDGEAWYEIAGFEAEEDGDVVVLSDSSTVLLTDLEATDFTRAVPTETCERIWYIGARFSDGRHAGPAQAYEQEVYGDEDMARATMQCLRLGPIYEVFSAEVIQ